MNTRASLSFSIRAGRSKWITGLLRTCVLAFFPFATIQAATLEPAHVVGLLAHNLEPPSPVEFTTFGAFSNAGPHGTVDATAQGLPGPELSAHAAIESFFFGRASVMLTYRLLVEGPEGLVPVTARASGSATGSSDPDDPDIFSGFALKSSWLIRDTGVGFPNPVFFSEAIESGFLRGGFSESFSKSVDLLLTANRPYEVTMVADASARGAVASAFIDPIFSFGPGVGPEYAFSFSEGIGNSAVPLPSALVLLSSAMAFVGTFRRRAIRSDVGHHAPCLVDKERVLPPRRSQHRLAPGARAQHARRRRA